MWNELIKHMGAVNVWSQLMVLKLVEIYFKCFECVQWKQFDSYMVSGSQTTSHLTYRKEIQLITQLQLHVPFQKQLDHCMYTVCMQKLLGGYGTDTCTV